MQNYVCSKDHNSTIDVATLEFVRNRLICTAAIPVNQCYDAFFLPAVLVMTDLDAFIP